MSGGWHDFTTLPATDTPKTDRTDDPSPMTWGEFKSCLEKQGIKDTDVIQYVEWVPGNWIYEPSFTRDSDTAPLIIT